MGILFAILLIGAVSAYLTSLPCRILYARHRRASWFLAPAGAGIVGVITVLFVYQGDVFHPSHWDRGKVPVDILMLMAFGIASLIGLLPALLVVGHYREEFSENDHEA